MPKFIYIIFGLMTCFWSAFAQDWKAPEEEKENVSIRLFDNEIETEGEVLFMNSCKSCHGTPTQEDFSLMLPSPGDLASDKVQNQTDGELFYKIRAGKGAMPKFGDALDQNEIWSLIAYVRSFNESYKQPEPNLEGVVIPNITLNLSFDDNVDKLVVKTLDENGNPMPDVTVKAFVKGHFGNYLLGKSRSNELGIAYFDIDSKMPGDEEGNMDIIVKASKGFGSAKVTQKMRVVDAVSFKSAIEGRHLWSVSKRAPYWLIVTFLSSLIGIWGTIIYVIVGLPKIKKQS